MTAHTALHAPQTSPHAAKPDDASPFSALLEAVAPKADKTKPKDKDASDDEAKDTKADTVKTGGKADSKTDAKADAPAQPDKSDKASDKPEDTAKTDAADAAQIIADPAQSPIQPPVQPGMALPAPVAVAAATTPDQASSDVEAVTGAGNIAPTPQPDKTAAAPQVDDEADDTAADAATPQDVTPQDIKGAPAPTPRKQTADAKPSKPDEIKAAKPDGIKTDGTKTDSPKPDAPQPDKIAAADVPATKPAPATGTNMAVHDIVAPQPSQANAPPNAPSVTQHVQVAAQAPAPMPNMPALAVEISAKSQSGAKQFDIRLDPPELGRVEVRLSIDATGKASAHLSADQPQTLDMLQKDSTSLMRALRDAGLDVSQDGLNFSLRQQTHQDSGAHQGGGRGSARNFSLTATTSLEATATSAAYRRPADGRIDISV